VSWHFNLYFFRWLYGFVPCSLPTFFLHHLSVKKGSHQKIYLAPTPNLPKIPPKPPLVLFLVFNQFPLSINSNIPPPTFDLPRLISQFPAGPPLWTEVKALIFLSAKLPPAPPPFPPHPPLFKSFIKFFFSRPPFFL